MAYVKLFASILDSTVWETDPATRVVWITLLAMADRDGIVEASVPGLARRAGVERAQCERALALFLAPDPDSRTTDHEGRRIEEQDGGWRLLNYEKYRDKATREEAAHKAAERQRRYRDRQKKKRAQGDASNVTRDGGNIALPEMTPVTDSEAHAHAHAHADAETLPPPPVVLAAVGARGAGSDFDEWRRAFARHYASRYSYPPTEGPKFGEHMSTLVCWGRDAGLSPADIDAVCAAFISDDGAKLREAEHWIGWLPSRAGRYLKGRRGPAPDPYSRAKAELAEAEKSGNEEAIKRAEANVLRVRNEVLNAAR